MKIAFELPFYSPFVGGITETVKIARHMGADIIFQHDCEHIIPFRHKVVRPNKDKFPTNYDIVITYSDNPHIDTLIKQSKSKIFVYMMSYGMAISRERYNALHPDITTLCTTDKIKDAIEREGGKVIKVGFSIDMPEMYNYHSMRRDRVVLYYHNSPAKRYSLAVDVADKLCANDFIDDVVTFGARDSQHSRVKKPINLDIHVFDANDEQKRNLFNSAQCFIMPSCSEGLNLTPVEATLCGCPSVIVDGATELFIPNETCIKCDKDDILDVYEGALEVLMDAHETLSDKFETNMREVCAKYTIDNLVANFKKIL
jgi:glycosyltransferase involved in cell wall biosynthesis